MTPSSCNSLPSSRTPRGHQFPGAFLDVVAGLRAFERRGGLPFVHIDIAGTAVVNGNWATGTPTGAPVLGAHTHEVLAELGLDDDAIAALEAEGIV